MKKNLAILFISTLISSSITLPSFSQKLPRPSIETSGNLVINWQLLNLTPNQRQRIQLLRLNFQKISIQLKAESNLKKLEVQQLLISPNSNPNKIRGLMKSKLQIDNKLQLSALDNFLQIKSILTTEQLTKLPRATNLNLN